MPVIVVGGNGRGVGKTALVCELIAAFPTSRWTAVKITSHRHGNTGPVWEEHEPGQETDTARYLAAGAQNSFLVTAIAEEIPLGAMADAFGGGSNLIFESNRILGRWKVDLCLGVLGGSTPEFKPSFLPFLHDADAFVLPPEMHRDDLPRLQPIFRWSDRTRVSPEMIEWLRQRLRT